MLRIVQHVCSPRILIWLSAIIWYCCLGGCASTSQYPVTIDFPDDHKMHFSGKGAGAGMMLMSSMGPMGIAIGVAIDEGIAKDIGATASSVNISALAKDAFIPLALKRKQPLNIIIAEYGFKTTRGVAGMQDPVFPVLKIRITGVEQLVELDETLAEACGLQARELADIKENGLFIESAFGAGFECLATSIDK